MNRTEKKLKIRLLKVLEFQKNAQNLLHAANADPQLTQDLNLLSIYLKKIDNPTLHDIFRSHIEEVAPVNREDDLAKETILKMSNKELAELLEREDLPRMQLERLAIVRFSVPKGGLSVLRTKKSLVDKLRDLLANEVGHEGIARVAAANPPPDDPTNLG